MSPDRAPSCPSRVLGWPASSISKYVSISMTELPDETGSDGGGRHVWIDPSEASDTVRIMGTSYSGSYRKACLAWVGDRYCAAPTVLLWFSDWRRWRSGPTGPGLKLEVAATAPNARSVRHHQACRLPRCSAKEHCGCRCPPRSRRDSSSATLLAAVPPSQRASIDLVGGSRG